MTKVNSPAFWLGHTDIFTPLSPPSLCLFFFPFFFCLAFPARCPALPLSITHSLQHNTAAAHRRNAGSKKWMCFTSLQRLYNDGNKYTACCIPTCDFHAVTVYQCCKWVFSILFTFFTNPWHHFEMSAVSRVGLGFTNLGKFMFYRFQFKLKLLI